MDAQRWQQVKEVLAAAEEQSPEERSTFLARTCGDDGELRREVESLLRQESEDSLEPVVPRPREGPDGLPTERRIGPWEIVGRLGSGGMAVVYLARHNEFEMQVAMKIVKRALATDEMIARFRHERQILARLEHPNIARLHDGGTLPDGRPYFVMDRVEGRSIRHYCQEKALPTDGRLRLFLDVCGAVAYAHQNFIVHSDLKPGNVLVTPEGTVKLLDFGIAHLLGSDDKPLAGNREVLGTLGYASPEQLRGEPVTTLSDVYSLGAVLYELLAGRRPFADLSATDQRAATISGRQVPKPSTAVCSDGRRGDPGKLRRRLRGDLDAIVLKALAAEPRERYGSVRELAADVERHFEDRPVKARQGAVLYTAGRFLHRHWGKTLVATAVLLLAIGLLVQGQQARIEQLRAEAEKERANLEKERTDELGKLLRTILLGSDPAAAAATKLPRVEVLLARGAEGLMSDTDLDPERRAELLMVIGPIYRRLGLFDEARRLLEESLRLRQEIFGEDSLQVANCRINLSSVYRGQSDFGKAEQAAREALRIYRNKYAGDHRAVARILNNLAGILKVKGDLAAAVDLYEEALAIKRRLLGDGDSKTLATALNNLGSALNALGDFDRAHRFLQDALEMRRRLGSPDPVATTLHNLAVLYRDGGDFENATVCFEQCLYIRRSLLGPDHYRVARVLRDFGATRRLQGRWAAAAQQIGQAFAIEERQLREGHPDLAITLRERAALALAQGDAPAAEADIREAIATLRARFPAEHWRIADAESVLGEALLEQGRLDEARRLLERSVSALEEVKRPAAREVREARRRLEALLETERVEDAR